MLDLRKMAREYMEKAKELLVKDGYLTPVVIIVGAELSLVELCFENEEEKEDAYSQVAALAREKKALACITINDTYMKMLPAKTKEEAEALVAEYIPGQLVKDPKAEEAIVVFAGTGVRGEEAWGLTCIYKKVNGKIQFEQVKEKKDTSEMFQNWN